MTEPPPAADSADPPPASWRPAVTWGSVSGLLMTLLVHVGLLGAAALIGLASVGREGPPLITVVADNEGDDLGLLESIVSLDTPALDAAPPRETVPIETVPLVPQPLDPTQVAVDPIPSGPSSVGIDGTSSGAAAGGDRFKLPSPTNAVRRGAFAAWTIPIAGPGEEVVPGQAPRVNQPYHIVIEIALPNTYRVYPLSDFYGRVIGTDGFKQEIPKRKTFYYNRRGQLVVASPVTRVPVRDGTVQLLVEVDGSSIPATQDTITLRSRRLREEEQLVLTFSDGPVSR